MKPSGVQFSSPIVPPGRVTRSSSSAVAWWCGANITPTHESTRSKAASAKGSASASASRHSSSTPSFLASRRPVSSRSGVRSLATTCAPRWAAGIAALPEPAATSRTRSPGPTPDASTRIGPRLGMNSLGDVRVVAHRPHRSMPGFQGSVGIDWVADLDHVKGCSLRGAAVIDRCQRHARIPTAPGRIGRDTQNDRGAANLRWRLTRSAARAGRVRRA